MFNTIDRFGLISILMHWVVALAIFGLFGLGWYMVELTYYDALYNTLPSVHKSLGILLAMVFAFNLIWRAANQKPKPLDTINRFEIIAARAAHLVLSTLIALIIISGYLIPTAKGVGINVFEWFTVPAVIAKFPGQEDIAGMSHRYLSYAIIGLVVLHAGAALKHHFIDKDDTLNRILRLPPYKS